MPEIWKMKYVLDVNMCRNNQLVNLLKEKNEILITSDFLVEVFKANNPKSLSFIFILSSLYDIPRQIFCFKTNAV